MKIQYKYLYLQQNEGKRWHELEYSSLDEALQMFARMWQYMICCKVLIALDGKLQGIIQVDSAGRLVYERGTEIQVLLTENVRRPEPLNLLPPELRRTM